MVHMVQRPFLVALYCQICNKVKMPETQSLRTQPIIFNAVTDVGAVAAHRC